MHAKRKSMLGIVHGLGRLAFALVLTFGLQVAGLAQSSEHVEYPFNRYPAKREFHGKPAAPQLATPNQRNFRTVLQNGSRKGPNFAGHYTLVQWGCGAGCVVYAVVDAVSGKVYDRDLPPTTDGYPCGLVYKLGSTLFVVEQSTTPVGVCHAKLYSWEGSHFVSVPPPALQ